ncbi:hypothetical protein G3576_02315 [Roseomonas stagni]|uniref:Calx-beta domain-containing protein n=1 Tax=Falsiroseomonas algicola TaxID=2716930 RepID=A0A6M1LEW6_9PROT|nr:Calx-beta domain-containing protein [Falsiroseomonas algicola]NGM18830.1 hypothetical protein [Falsiroseomonas algicola]
MSDRDPTWTDIDAAQLTGTNAWRRPEGQLSFLPEIFLDVADNAGFVGGQPVDVSRLAFVTVTLTEGNLYHFWGRIAQNAPGTPTLSIYDSQGYRLQSVDGDDISPGSDTPWSDSLLYFEPDRTGTYYLGIGYSTRPFASGFSIEGWEDTGGNFANDRAPYSAIASLSAPVRIVTEGDAGSTRYTATVTRTGDLSKTQSVGWFVDGRGDHAADDADFAGGLAPGGTITFGAGQATAQITIDIAGDTIGEYDETFGIRLFAPSTGLRIGTGRIEATIEDDDSRLWLEAASLTATEGTGTGGSFTFTIRANAPQEAYHSVRWVVETTDVARPVNARDFSPSVLPSGVVTFAPGETAKTVTITFAGDATPESDERFRIRLESRSDALTTSDATSIIVQILDDDRPLVSIAALAATVVEGSGEGGTVSFEVTRTNPVTAQTIDWAASGLSAADFADGVIPSGRLSFAAGEASKTVTLRLRGDSIAEGAETLTVTISSPSAGTEFRNTQASVSILDDDSVVRVLPGSRSTTEDSGTPITFVLERSGDVLPAATLTWQAEAYADTSSSASADASDFVGGAWPGGVVTFGEGQRQATVTIAVQPDATPEPGEWFSIRLTNPSLGMSIEPYGDLLGAAIWTDETWLSDNAISAAPHREGDGLPTTLNVPIWRQGDYSAAETFTWRVTTAIPGYTGALATGSHFAGGVLPSGQVTFAPGMQTAAIALSIASDDRPGVSSAAFAVEFTAQRPGAGADRIIRVIEEDDVLVSIQSATVQQAEGDSGVTPFTFTLTRTGGTTGSSVVDWSVGTTTGRTVDADDFGDWRLPSGQVVFAPGETTATLTVNVYGDLTPEASERFVVNLTSASPDVAFGNASARGIILADDTEVTVSAYNAVKTEGHTGSTRPFLFTVERAGVTDVAQSVAWSVAPGRGADRANAADFVGGVLPSGVVDFAPGEVRKIITVNVNGDASRERDEFFFIDLSNPTNGLRIGNYDAYGLIIADETVMSIAATSADAAEGSTPHTFTVTRSGYLDAAQIVNWSVVNWGPNRVSAADFEGGAIPRGALRFEAGEETKTITINIASDTAVEKDETFAVRLLSASPGVTLAPYWAGATIRNDDASVGITALSASKAEGNAGTTPFTFALTRTGVLDAEQSVSWATGSLNPNRATAADFAGGVLPSGTVTFGAGEARKVITLDVLGDTTQEAAEGFIVRLSAPTNGLTISGSSATGLIQNDDLAVARLAADWVL